MKKMFFIIAVYLVNISSHASDPLNQCVPDILSVAVGSVVVACTYNAIVDQVGNKRMDQERQDLDRVDMACRFFASVPACCAVNSFACQDYDKAGFYVLVWTAALLVNIAHRLNEQRKFNNACRNNDTLYNQIQRMEEARKEYETSLDDRGLRSKVQNVQPGKRVQ